MAAFAPSPTLFPSNGIHDAPARGKSRSTSRPRVAIRAAPRAVVVFSPAGTPAMLTLEDLPEKHAPFRGMVADEVIGFMNTELKNHLACYVCKFGHKIHDMGLINEININSLTDCSVNIDVVTCDQDGCVCVQEELPWLDGAHLNSADDVPEELRKMSLACGLPVDVF